MKKYISVVDFSADIAPVAKGTEVPVRREKRVKRSCLLYRKAYSIYPWCDSFVKVD